MEKIYGNSSLIDRINKMRERNKMPQSVIFYGEKGCGKKLMADYYTASLLYESPVNGSPCGKCRTCINISSHLHPDIKYVETSGKSKIYTVSTMTDIISDSVIKPNNDSGKKVYIFEDCHDMPVNSQNKILKLIEEPPAYCTFIFTAEKKQTFLSTIISRCVCFSLSQCTEEEAKSALAESGFPENDVKKAVGCFHGNIGLCKDYLTNPETREKVDLTKRLADSIIKRDEYGLYKNFFALGENKEDIYAVLAMADKLFRDAAAVSKVKETVPVSCYPEGGAVLANVLSLEQIMEIYFRFSEIRRIMEANVKPSLALAALSGDIMNIIG